MSLLGDIAAGTSAILAGTHRAARGRGNSRVPRRRVYAHPSRGRRVYIAPSSHAGRRGRGGRTHGRIVYTRGRAGQLARSIDRGKVVPVPLSPFDRLPPNLRNRLLVGHFLSSAIGAAVNPPPSLVEQVGKAFAPAVGAPGSIVEHQFLPNDFLSQAERYGKGLAKASFNALPPVAAYHAADALLSGHPGRLPGIGFGIFKDLTGVNQVSPIIAGEKALSEKVLRPQLQHFSKGKGGAAVTAAVKASGLNPGKGVGALLVNAGKDAINLPAEVVPSAALTIQHPAEVAKQFPISDPWGRLIFHGDTKAIQQHPLVAALEVAGVKGGIGRGLGHGASLIDKIARTNIAATARQPLRLYAGVEGGPVIPRHYSGGPGHVDLIGKAGQKALERAKIATGRDPNAAVHNLLFPKARLRYQALKRADDLAHQGEGLRRIDRGRARQQVHETFQPQGRTIIPGVLHRKSPTEIHTLHEPAVHLAVEHVLRGPDTIVKDLRTYRSRLVEERQAVKLDANQERLYQSTLKHVDALLKDKHLHTDSSHIFAAADRLSAQAHGLTGQLGERGLLSGEAASSNLIPYAIVHMKARPSKRYWLEDAKGNQVTPEMVREHLQRSSGVAGFGAHGPRAGSPVQHEILSLQAQLLKIERKLESIPTTKRPETPGVIVTGGLRGGEMREAAQHAEPRNRGRRADLEQQRKRLEARLKDAEARFAAHARLTEPGFISQKEGGRNPYFAPAGGKAYARPALSNARRRTGAATALGLHRLGKAPIEESMARSAGDVSQAMSWDEAMSELGIHKPYVKTQGGKPYVAGRRYFRSWDEAARAGNDVAQLHPELGRLVPVKAGQLAQVHDLVTAGVPDQQTLVNVSEAMRDAFRHDPGHQGQYLLVPEFMQRRLLGHLQPRGPWAKRIHRFARIWRQSVLSGSLKWLFGNAADVSQRTLAHGLTPLDYARGRSAVHQLERGTPEMQRAADKLRTNVVGGAFYSAAERGTFSQPGPFLQAPPGASFVRRAMTYPARTVRTAWRGWTDVWFRPEAAIERQPQYAALGKLARTEVKRDLRSIRGFLKIGGPAMADWVKGLTETPNQLKAQRYAEQIFGRWGKNSPEAKRFLAEQAPFAQWARVALKYIYYTLPVKHPVKTAVLASVFAMTDAERRKLGLDLFAGDNSLPDYLQGSVPTQKGLIRAQGYTSAGILSQFPASIGNFLMPELLPGIQAFSGHDWKGDQLVLPNGAQPDAGQRALLGLYIIGSGLAPGLSILQRIFEHGGRPMAGSTVLGPTIVPGSGKSGSQTFNKIFNPLAPVSNTRPIDIHINQLYQRANTLNNRLKVLRKNLRRDRRGNYVYTGKAKRANDELKKVNLAIGALRRQRRGPSDTYIPPSQRAHRGHRFDPLGTSGGGGYDPLAPSGAGGYDPLKGP